MAAWKNIKRYPLIPVARKLLVIALLVNILTLIVAVYYQTTTGLTPYLIIPSIFFAIIFFIALLLRYRYALLERYPYLVSLPSFAWRLGAEKSPAVQGQIISRVYTIHTLAILFISVLGLAETYLIPTAKSSNDTWAVLAAIFLIVACFVVSVFTLYRSIYREYAKRK